MWRVASLSVLRRSYRRDFPESPLSLCCAKQIFSPSYHYGRRSSRRAISRCNTIGKLLDAGLGLLSDRMGTSAVLYDIRYEVQYKLRSVHSAKLSGWQMPQREDVGNNLVLAP